MAATEELTPTPTRAHRVAYYVAAVIIGVAILGVGSLGTVLWIRHNQWDPLGDYPLQTIVDPDPTPVTIPGYSLTQSALPTIYLDEQIQSSGVKCVGDVAEGGPDRTVTVTGVLSWVSDEPPGKIIEAGRGGGERGPHCVNYTFLNSIPPQVKAEIRRLGKLGIHESTWHLTGTETPVRADGEKGVPRTWVTTSFRIVNANKPTG